VAAASLTWRLRRLRVCASTEIELARWLAVREARGLGLPGRSLAFAVVARRQRFGVGQQGRLWHSPAGGLWLSAAFPWSATQSAAPLALAASVGLALQLERLGLRPRIKWPNDLLLEGRKLAGVLPRLRWRGTGIRWAQVGVGLNGVNRVPTGAIALAEPLVRRLGGSAHRRRFHPGAIPARLEPLVLAGLSWAAAQVDAAECIRHEAEARLWVPADGWTHDHRRWQVRGLSLRGGLLLQRGHERRTLLRF
jgi:BirA family biotin operon repressor/biotin-[acetyl-CoA-carboxylase] ligase